MLRQSCGPKWNLTLSATAPRRTVANKHSNKNGDSTRAVNVITMHATVRQQYTSKIGKMREKQQFQDNTFSAENDKYLGRDVSADGSAQCSGMSGDRCAQRKRSLMCDKCLETLDNRFVGDDRFCNLNSDDGLNTKSAHSNFEVGERLDCDSRSPGQPLDTERGCRNPGSHSPITLPARSSTSSCPFIVSADAIHRKRVCMTESIPSHFGYQIGHLAS